MEAYAREVYAGKITTGQVHRGMWDEYYKGFRSTYEGSVKPGIRVEYGPDWAFNQQIQSNLSTFSAFKNHSNTADMVGLLVDKDGNFKPYRQWRKDVDPILGKYNENWLQAEHQTAKASARMAEKWQNFQRRKATYPNLKYITQADERVRASHRPLHHIVRPVDDPFWDTNYPPNGWRCRCDVQQTDEAVSGEPGTFEPPKAWKINVGKNADLFPKEHPYKEASKLNKGRVKKQAEPFLHQLTRSEVKEWARDNIASKAFNLPGIPGPAKMSVSNVKKSVGQRHPNRAARNELIYILDQIIDKGPGVKLIASAQPRAGEHLEILRFFYYEIKIDDLIFYLNVAQYRHNIHDLRIYAITQSVYGFD